MACLNSTLIGLVLFHFTAISAWAGVTCQPFWPDYNSLVPMDPNHGGIYHYTLMAGSQVVFLVSSDLAVYWEGGCLIVDGSAAGVGQLYARDFNEVTLDWEGSRYPEAGPMATVWSMVGWFGPRLVQGYQFMGSDNARPGRWFCIDYKAVGLGRCRVEFYDYSSSYLEPVATYVFDHVTSRDLDADGRVALPDLALLGLVWRQPVGTQVWADLDGDGYVRYQDLWQFTRFWLERSR